MPAIKKAAHLSGPYPRGDADRNEESAQDTADEAGANSAPVNPSERLCEIQRIRAVGFSPCAFDRALAVEQHSRELSSRGAEHDVQWDCTPEAVKAYTDAIMLGASLISQVRQRNKMSPVDSPYLTIATRIESKRQTF